VWVIKSAFKAEIRDHVSVVEKSKLLPQNFDPQNFGRRNCRNRTENAENPEEVYNFFVRGVKTYIWGRGGIFGSLVSTGDRKL